MNVYTVLIFKPQKQKTSQIGTSSRVTIVYMKLISEQDVKLDTKNDFSAHIQFGIEIQI